MEETILITGANRGIGLELARQYALAGWQVYATCRSPENALELNNLAASQAGRVSVHPLDVTDHQQIQALARAVGDRPVDILFNNAGTYGQAAASFGKTDETKWLEAFRVNTIAPMKMMETFVDNVAASRRKLIATMSSKMGSMSDNASGGSYVYRSSKAAVNAVMKSAAIDLAPRGIIAVALHPGWVKTDMGGANAQISVQQSVDGLRRLLDRLTDNDSGQFLEVDGSRIPW